MNQAKILWDLHTFLVMANQLDITVVNKQKKMVIVIDVAILSDNNFRNMEHEKFEKYKG